MQFVDITDDNARHVECIFAGDQAQYWVHYNAYWLEQSRAHDDIESRLIVVGEHAEPVGFIAYGQHYQDEDLTQPIPNTYEIIHLVIDDAHQRKGYGKQATQLAITLLQANPDCHRIVIAHNPDNVPAKRLYEALGFVVVGENYDGDPLLEYRR